MDIMGEWLSTTIQSDLGKVIDSTHGPPTDPSHDVFEDDGSNIRVKLSKPGIVQIVKWEKYVETFQAWVSDSVIRLKATFASEAAIQHEQKTGRRLAEGTLGNIIQLNDAEAVATHLGPSTSKITLFVSTFKVIGSDTSAEIGNPRPFDATPEFSQLLAHLSAYRGSTGSTLSAVKATSEQSAVGPRRASFTPINAGGPGSQQLFSQVPARFIKEKTNGTPQRRHLTGRRLSHEPPEVHERSAAGGPVDQNEALLALMRSKNTRINTEKQSPENVNNPATNPAPSTEDVVDSQDVSSPKPVSTIGGASLSEEVASRPLRKSSVNGQKLMNRRSNKPGRIRSRDVRISKAQQDLLDSEDSWLPAKPGQRAPVANLPHAVLEQITQSVEAGSTNHSLDAGGEPPMKDLQPLELPIAESPTQDTGNLTPEIPISSSEWPSSSPVQEPQHQLPPDSSMEVCSESDREPKKQLPQRDNDTYDASFFANDILPPSGRDFAASSPIEGYTTTEEPVPSEFEPNIQQHWVGDRNDSRKQDSDSSMSASTTQSSAANQAPSVIECEPASSDRDSDLETQIPLKLRHREAPITDIMSTQEVPATAIQPEEPVLQVKRTPYVDQAGRGYRPNLSDDHSARVRYSSPSKRRRLNDPATANVATDIGDESRMDEVALSEAIQVHASGINRYSPHASIQAIDETALIRGQEGNDGEKSDKAVFERASGIEHPLPLKAADVKALEDTAGTPAQQGSPRRKAESPLLSPYVSKRRKVHKAALRFDFSQDEYPKEDPSVTARRQREEFMASQKNSRTGSLTSPHGLESERPTTPWFDDDQKSLNSQETRRLSEVSANTPRKHGVPDSPFRVPDSKSASFAGNQPSDVANQDPLVHSGAVATGQCSQLSIGPDAGGANLVSNLDMPVIANQEHDLLLTQCLHSDMELDPTAAEAGAQTSAKTSQQTTNSGQAQSIPELMTPAMSVSEIRQSNSPSLNALSALHGDQRQPSIFQQFKSAYPDYSGTEEHFLGMCRKIYQLLRADRMEHKSLWDDFVIRHKTDYPLYLPRCLEAAEDAKPYERFYRDEIDAPKYFKRILQPNVLSDLLKTDLPTSVADKLDISTPVAKSKSPILGPDQPTVHPLGRIAPSSPVRSALSVTSGEETVVEPGKPSGMVTRPSRQPHASQPSGSREKSSQTRVRETSTPKRETIDLTGEGSSSPEPRTSPIRKDPSLMQHTPRTPRKLPWQQDKTASQQSARHEPLSKDQLPIKSPTGRSALQSAHDVTPSRSTKTSVREETEANTRRKVGHPSSSQAQKSAQKKLLSESRGVKVENSMSITPTPRKAAVIGSANARQTEQSAGEVDEWWKDENTPFREFARCYRGIKPGNGNAWAQEMQGEKKKEEQRPESRPAKSGKAANRLPFDINNWYL
ncbi:MAG: hypothetical protein Q9222_005711 [Ikaeria aurantiellina]